MTIPDGSGDGPRTGVVTLVFGEDLVEIDVTAKIASLVETQKGVVVLDQKGAVGVVLGSGEVVTPDNGAGLMRTGAIAPGDEVVVRIFADTDGDDGGDDRGHVMIIKRS